MVVPIALGSGDMLVARIVGRLKVYGANSDLFFSTYLSIFLELIAFVVFVFVSTRAIRVVRIQASFYISQSRNEK